MNNNKVYTTLLTGKCVRFLGFLIFFILCTISCVDEPVTTDVIDNITGTWSVTETNNGTKNFQVTISKASDNSVYIYNFNLLGSAYRAEVDVDGLNLSIPSQVVHGNTISGSGTVSSGYKRIDLNYEVNDGGGVESYLDVLTPN